MRNEGIGRLRVQVQAAVGAGWRRRDEGWREGREWGQRECLGEQHRVKRMRIDELWEKARRAELSKQVTIAVAEVDVRYAEEGSEREVQWVKQWHEMRMQEAKGRHEMEMRLVRKQVGEKAAEMAAARVRRTLGVSPVFEIEESEVLALVAQLPREEGGFRVIECEFGGVQLLSVCYVSLDDRNFPQSRAVPVMMEEFMKDCRGLLVCASSGRVVGRPLHKFFNYGQRQDSSLANMSEGCVMLEKLDGVMV